MARVLVVDDHSPARSLMRAILRLDGHEVVEAATGDAALAEMQKTRFDLVMLDLAMPVVDGYTVLETMRATPATEKTPVVVVSAADETVDLMRTAELGALEHLSKPFGYDEMERIVNRILNATEDELTEMRVQRAQAAQQYHRVIDLVEDAKTPKGRRFGWFRRARASAR